MIDEEKVKIVKILEDAACQFGPVMDALETLERINENGKITEQDDDFLEIATLAAKFARLARGDVKE